MSGHRSRRMELWALPIGLAVHNVEEGAGLPGWSEEAGRWHPPVGAGELRSALAVLTVEAGCVTEWAWRAGPRSRGAAVWAGINGLLLVNVVVPHVAATVALRRYAPGVITALAINLPLCATLLVRAIAGGFVTRRQAQAGTAIAVVVTAVEIPLLFAVGRRVFRAPTR